MASKYGWVYALHKDVPWARDHYKLGFTTYSVESALSRAITGSSFPVRIYGSWRVKNVYKAEAKLHDRFAHKRIVGGGREWFRLNIIDLQLIEFIISGE